MTFRFSTHGSEMDRDLIHSWLSEQSYWALGRSRGVMDAAMRGSVNFGMFDDATGAQVAYARVITDSATFAWLADVFVDEGVRGQGVGVALMEGIWSVLEPLDLRRIALVTADAHELYEKFGFATPEKPEMWMTRISQPEPSAN